MTPPTPRFIYFDMGNVLLHFDEHRATRQIASLTGVDQQRVHQVVYGSGLQDRYETGTVTPQQFRDEFCQATGAQPPLEALEHAASDMFELNVPIVPLVAHLKGAGHALGILSNTCSSHWHHVHRRFTLIRAFFPTTVLSYHVGAMKPAASIYEQAAEMAQVRPQEIFFMDDRPANVEAAKDAGFDAVLFTDVPALAADLRSRGIEFNF